MAAYYLDTDDALELMEEHGYEYYSISQSTADRKYTVGSFATRRLVRLHHLQRLPRLRITANQVLQLSLLPNEKARTALTDAWEQELLGVESDVNSASNTFG